MENESNVPTFKSFLRGFFIIQVVIFVAVAVICLLTGGLNATSYSSTLFLAGAAVVIFGTMRVFSTNSLDRSFNVRYAQTVGSQSIGDSTRRLVREAEMSFGTGARAFLVGIVPIIISFIITAISNMN